MDNKELGRLYGMACANAHDLIDQLYESIHTDSGMPITDPERVKSLRVAYQAKIRYELELIQSAAVEADETKPRRV